MRVRLLTENQSKRKSLFEPQWARSQTSKVRHRWEFDYKLNIRANENHYLNHSEPDHRGIGSGISHQENEQDLAFIDTAVQTIIVQWKRAATFLTLTGLTLVLLNPGMPCLCKQCRSRSVGFFRSQLTWICTVCHSVCEFISTTWIKLSDWLKIRSGRGLLIYSAWQGLTTKYAVCHITSFYIDW